MFIERMRWSGALRQEGHVYRKKRDGQLRQDVYRKKRDGRLPSVRRPCLLRHAMVSRHRQEGHVYMEERGGRSPIFYQ